MLALVGVLAHKLFVGMRCAKIISDELEMAPPGRQNSMFEVLKELHTVLVSDFGSHFVCDSINRRR